MADKIKPISPEEAVVKKEGAIPDIVFEVFNELIILKLLGNRAFIYQKEAEELMVAKGLDRREIYDKGWMNVEKMYRAAGWKVEYDKPGFNESHDPHFIFTKLSKNNE